MSTLTKDKAWVIFRADKLGQIEGKAALDALTKPEFDAYECYAEDFDLEIAKIGVEAQNEAADIVKAYPELEDLNSQKQWAFTAGDYISIVSMFKGSKFETLHLSALFGVPNNELLLELVKP